MNPRIRALGETVLRVKDLERVKFRHRRRLPADDPLRRPRDRRRGVAHACLREGRPAHLLKGDWLAPGAHVNAVGAPRPTWRELDDAVLARARIYVESREAALRESGDVIAAGQVFAEIGEVVAGTRAGRGSENEITLFKSVGVAIEDVVTADLVYRKIGQASGADRHA